MVRFHEDRCTGRERKQTCFQVVMPVVPEGGGSRVTQSGGRRTWEKRHKEPSLRKGVGPAWAARFSIGAALSC